ncbi:hypothetical protein C2857_005064 [Epichloe festucae Fl1]|uniref:Uncharacterized protein n=1 Tax=Epichloe festucae (strain Fl1) TaxID=877507 RepID=A0A7S9KV59_EPIFF|nr:hypothetical protein C2857_005064 [Epichloe festucae Fl1]
MSSASRHLIFPSPEAQRLRWTLPAPLTSAISVLDNAQNPDGPREPYFQESRSTWHPISEEPMSYPLQSSITVEIYQLDVWEHQWEEYHEHADPNDSDCVFAPSDDEGPGELLECCGEQRPKVPPPVVVTASNKEYITVHDYVSTVHSYLMEHFEDISAAENVWEGGVPPAGQKLVVSYDSLQLLMIIDESMYLPTAGA